MMDLGRPELARPFRGSDAETPKRPDAQTFRPTLGETLSQPDKKWPTDKWVLNLEQEVALNTMPVPSGASANNEPAA